MRDDFPMSTKCAETGRGPAGLAHCIKEAGRNILGNPTASGWSKSDCRVTVRGGNPP